MYVNCKVDVHIVLSKGKIGQICNVKRTFNAIGSVNKFVIFYEAYPKSMDRLGF